MGLIISLVIAVFLIGTFSYLRPSRKMRFLSDLRLEAIKLGFKINNSMELKHKFKKSKQKMNMQFTSSKIHQT